MTRAGRRDRSPSPPWSRGQGARGLPWIQSAGRSAQMMGANKTCKDSAAPIVMLWPQLAVTDSAGGACGHLADGSPQAVSQFIAQVGGAWAGAPAKKRSGPA